ncbi:DUF1761 domain-containing protein [Pannonibacter tanglangensis]|uniref:DUF1761 family protein n=1 Tax=Pannonibacter tanglangensis TaxID=2750084 RepID=A0ABW9ZMR9_9HYPH|nr:DUF1761 domain-containing protein [Pannonibacter sp. XCT-34]NBN65581.1 DUF1761 family protein [Pannonibacter sp. XCT-34]
MMFDGINLIGVAVAGLVSFCFSLAWHLVLGSRWQRLAGVAPGTPQRDPLTLVVSLVAHLLMAFIFAGVIYHAGGLSVKSGLISAGMIWTGFFLTSLVVTHRHQRSSPLLTLIESLHWLGVVGLQGLAIGIVG